MAKRSSSGKVNKTSGKKKVQPKTGNTQKSATIRSIERQKRLENTMPLGGLTSELPFLGNSAYDAPIRRPWKSKDGRGKSLSRGRVSYNVDNANEAKNSKRHKYTFKTFVKYHKLLCASLILALALVISAGVIISIYTVDTVLIEGNAHYTNEEIYSMVISDKLSRSSIYLSMKYKNKDIEDIPFIQTMNVKIVNPSTIKITVYEKAMAGFVEHMGRYFYFDKDGTVVESSEVITKGIPQIMGLNYDHIVLYEKLPVDSDGIFKEILEVTQLLTKHELEVDKIYFDSNYDITLYFNDARVKLGDFNNIDEKIIRLKAILPELTDKKGVLRLDNYTGNDNIITFEKDKE